MSRGTERGWGAVAALALASATLSVASPLLLIFVPLALLVFALPPRRPAMLIGAAIWVYFVFQVTAPGTLGYAELGWAFVLGGWFVLMAAVWPEARFLGKALAALAAAVATGAVLLALRPGAWQLLDWAVSRHFQAAAGVLAQAWGATEASQWWAAQIVDGVYRAADLQTLLHPALLALASLAGLAVAWWGYKRMGGTTGEGLAPFREFRFRDELVWILIAGIVLVVLPLDGLALRAGSNLVAFMGALYALRGVAVLLALTGVPGFGAIALGLLALLILPMVMLGAAFVGLADTWIDLRARRTAGSGS